MAKNQLKTPEEVQFSNRRPNSQPIFLASQSPRRRDLMLALIPRPVITSPTVDEVSAESFQAPEEYVVQLSRTKAESASVKSESAIIVGADTVVVLGDQILGKPSGPAEARRMLESLRGRTHRVVTGVTVLDTKDGVPLSVATTSYVSMRFYSDAEINAYVNSGEPFDKAGGYAVQDLTFKPAESTQGCYLNIVGLPICEVVLMIREIGTEVEFQPGWTPPVQCTDCKLRYWVDR